MKKKPSKKLKKTNSNDGTIYLIEESINTLNSNVKRLDYVDRYSSIPTVCRETVSQHSYWVTLYSALIHKAVSNDDDIMRLVLLKSVTHDIMECVTGDFVRTFKHSSTDLKSAIDKAEKGMKSLLPLSVRNLMEDAVTGNDLIDPYVSDVVKVADFMSLYHFMTRELERGNREIIPFYKIMVNDLYNARERTSKYSHTKMVKNHFSGVFPSLYYVHLYRMAKENLEKATCDQD